MSPRLSEDNLQLVFRLFFLFSPLVHALPHLSTASNFHVGYRGNKVAPQNIAPGYSVHATRHHNTFARRHREDSYDWTNNVLDGGDNFAAMPSPRPKSQSGSKSTVANDDPIVNDPSASGNATQYSKSQSSPDRPDTIYPPSPTPSSGPSLRAGGCAQLEQLYTDMNGPSWHRQQGWETSDGSCCTWSGVTCKGAGISALDLASNGLSGPLSSSIFALSDLEHLNLSSNALSGPLPDKFHSLPALKIIALDSNNFTGNIPQSIASHPLLATVHLSQNQFVGPASFSSSSLANLMIDRNFLESLVVTSNTRFVRFAANDNAFTGDLPDFSFATSLRIFNVARNEFTGSIFDITKLVNLTRFDVRNNMLSGPFPHDVSSLSYLTNFALSSNALSGEFPSTMAPASLTTCIVLPNNVQIVPSESVLADHNSLASKCGLRSPSSSRVNAISTVQPENYAAISPGEGWLDRPGAGGVGGMTSASALLETAHNTSSAVFSGAADRTRVAVVHVASLAIGVAAFTWL